MLSDSLPISRQSDGETSRGGAAHMLPQRCDARWTEAILLTIAVWLFVLLIFLPVIYDRHQGDIPSVLLDSATVPVSMLFAMPLFALFRRTLGWPVVARTATLVAAIVSLGIVNRMFDILWTGLISANVEASWALMPRTLERSYSAILNYVLVFSVNMALFQLSCNRRFERRQDRKLIDARSAAQQAQLAALRYQLNPHFLFNTLNSISALIVTKRNADAEQMTDKLSSFLRASLATDPAALTPLEEELSLIEEYLDIEAVRFGERLDVTIECTAEAGEALVPGFLVQPLVENAIKHGVAPSRDPVRITVTAAIGEGNLCITVSNDSPEHEQETSFGRKGVGLLNVRQRLEAVYGRAASLTTGRDAHGYTATICIPEPRE